MGKRKGGNKSVASFSEKSSCSNGYLVADATVCGVDNAEVDVAEERTESSNLVDPPEVEALVGSDKTSADYYFDSYSHFGISSPLYLRFDRCFVSRWIIVSWLI